MTSSKYVDSVSVSVLPVVLTGDKIAAELYRLGGYSSSYPSYWTMAIDSSMPIPKRTEPVERTIELVSFNEDMSTDDVLMVLVRRHRLQPPTYEDALCLGAAYRDEGRQRPIVFLHGAVMLGGVFEGKIGVIVIGPDKQGRDLRLISLRKWPQQCLFAGIRPVPRAVTNETPKFLRFWHDRMSRGLDS